jgi:hypothetical protein
MLEPHTRVLEDGHTHHVTWSRDGAPLTFREVVAAWTDDDEFNDRFTEVLAAAPFDAYFWETPPVTRGAFDRPFEFVLVASRSLATLAPEPGPFASHFRARDVQDDVTTFWNLGGDALLVAPCPVGPPLAYPHLAAFARSGPPEQQRAFWRAVGRAVEARLRGRRTWLSTSGLGVGWLHARLDDRPKYYQHAPYRADRG